MQKKERIAQLLSNGVPATDIASIVGCSPTYLAALKEDEEFRGFVAFYQDMSQQEASVQEEDERLDDKYVALENKLVKQLSDDVGMMEPAQAIRLLQNVSDRNDKRRGMGHVGTGGAGAVHVTINVPPAAVEQRPGFTISAQKEVVAVGDRALAPMSMEGVAALRGQAYCHGIRCPEA